MGHGTFSAETGIALEKLGGWLSWMYTLSEVKPTGCLLWSCVRSAVLNHIISTAVNAVFC